MIRRPPRSTLSSSSAASDVYKRQTQYTPHSIFSLYSQKESGGRLAAQDAEALQRVLTPRLREQFRERSEDREVEYGYNMGIITEGMMQALGPVSYTHLRAHETPEHLVCRLLLEKKKKKTPRVETILTI
eukprot:TRINITY_DN15675_c0_g1_i4.p1 TRINITY_DN15675_c0_g1~~TRINITY_DN15675_c0_g1_i4.p1  ORF type:complete len:130 (-),score=39.19 TRINITY_DN15675_c0_g1_i4:35-424(-)